MVYHEDVLNRQKCLFISQVFGDIRTKKVRHSKSYLFFFLISSLAGPDFSNDFLNY